jgi:hypothetical protein
VIRGAGFHGAVFDVDGVLVDSPHELAWREALEQLMKTSWSAIRDQTTYSPERFTPEVYRAHMSGKTTFSGARAALHYYTFPSRLPAPSRLAVPARPVVVGAAPTRTLRFQGQAAPSFNDPLRRAAVGSLAPLDHSTPRGALRARGTIRASRRGGHRKARARSPSSKTG